MAMHHGRPRSRFTSQHDDDDDDDQDCDLTRIESERGNLLFAAALPPSARFVRRQHNSRKKTPADL